MSPPVISPHSTFEISKPDFCNTNSFESSKSFGFSLDSTCTAGFDYSKTASEKSHISTRSRPRLMKMRKRQMPTSQDGKTVKSDIGLNGLSGVSGEKADNLGNAVGVDNRNLGSSASGASADFNRNMEELGSGLGFSVGVSGSSVGLGSEYGKPLFDSSTNSSTSKPQCDFSFTFNKGNSNFDVQKENGSFVFGARKDSPTMNQNLPGAFPDHGSINNGLKMDANLASWHFNFGVDKSNFNEKVSRGNLGQGNASEFQKSDTQFVFGSDNHDSGSRVKLGQQDFIKSGLGLSADEPAKVNDANFVFGARKGASGTVGSGIVDKSEFDRVSGNTIPDVRGKVKLDSSGDSEKVRDSCFQFPYNYNDSSNENHVKFVFASGKRNSKVSVDLENKSTDRDKDMQGFTDSQKGNVESGFQSQNACLNGVFVFGGLKGKGGLNPNGSTEPFAELNKGKTEDCDGFGQNSHNLFAELNHKFHISGSSGNSFEKDSAFSVSDVMKRLNIGGSEVDDKKSGSFIGNFAVNTNNVFVFGGDGKNIDSTKENHPMLSQNTPKVNRSSHNNFDERSSSFFPSSEIGVDQNGEVLSMNDGDKDSISFKSKLAGLDSSNSDFSTPNMKFDFSNNNLFPGIDKLDKTNLRSMGGKKSKKHGKLKQRTVVQRLFSQNHVSEEGNFQKNQESPNYGSPMDFSPYQNTSANNAPVVDTTTEVKENLSTNGEHTLEQCEKSCDDMSSSEFSFSLAAQDGRPALKTQHKKKYKLKVGSNPTVQKKGPVKENAKQEPSGTAIHEACEHWRLRGNDAYHAGQLSKAEELYSMGINSAPHVNTMGYSMKPLLLCYSNRAATRMSLGRMRDAIGDCTKASELDSDFLKATLRAGNCYLVLGEVEDAIKCYTKCLSNATSICLDRRVTIEAADGLHKAKKVAEHMLLSSNLLQEGTDVAASSALEIIEEALLISRFSEGLLEMKGEVLFMMRMYDKVIQLCDQTLDIAENNLGTDLLNTKSKSSHVKLWRWHLQTKSLYRLGKLDSALDLIGKLENLPFSSKSGDETWESVIALAANIRELLSLKKSGNEAFSSGRYNEAIENYTSAISKSFESRGFMAICFCNRAAAFQSLNQISDAISDCSVAVALDENYLKAISRRATLHEMIRDYKQAVIDLQKLASLLESQSQTKTQARSSGGSVRDLRKTRRRLSLAEEKAKMENSLDLYLILGIKASDSESEIKKAYRKAALRHHPDKAGQVLSRNDVADDGTFWKEFGEKIYGDADRMFKIIGEAYAVLSDPSKRSKYDVEEEMKKIYRDNNRSNNTDHPSTSYKSPFGRQGGFSSSFERNGGGSSRRHWYNARSYSYSHSHW